MTNVVLYSKDTENDATCFSDYPLGDPPWPSVFEPHQSLDAGDCLPPQSERSFAPQRWAYNNIPEKNKKQRCEETHTEGHVTFAWF